MHDVSLHHLAASGLLPTPKAQNANAPGEHGHGGKDLQTVIMGMLPTPQAADGFKGCANQNQDSLHKTFQTGPDSQLNPRFVAEMMGFPPDWLELPFLATGANPSRHTEMQSCRKSRCKSSRQSSNPKGK